jgi:hypothetical protein
VEPLNLAALLDELALPALPVTLLDEMFASLG